MSSNSCILFKTLFSFVFLFASFCLNAQTQNDTLIGMVDGELIKINKNTGNISNYVTITNFPTTFNPYRLTWAAPDNCYYTACNVNGIYQLGQISYVGNSAAFTLLGPVSVAGQNAQLIEGVSYNRFDSTLYLSVSLNGSPNSSPPDYWSETLVTVNTTTLVGTIVGTFSHTTVQTPEADVLSFDDSGMMYYSDGAPPGANFLNIHEQPADMSTGSTAIYSSTFHALSDLTVKNNVLYFSTNRQLRRIDLATNTYGVVGTMFTAAQFNGELLRGITWRNVCQDEVFTVPSVQGCVGDIINLDASAIPGATYIWSSGASSSSIDVTTGGTYWVQVTDSLCSFTDSVDVIFANPPVVNAGIDDTVCNGDFAVLNAASADPTDIFTWDSGVSNGTQFYPVQTAMYTVQATNAAGCSSFDSVEVVVISSGNPTFSYPMQSFCVSDQPQFPSNIATSGGTFSVSPNGLSIDPITGEIDPSNSLENTYAVTYSLSGLCSTDSTISVTIGSNPIISSLPNIVVCEDSLVTISNPILSSGATMQWTNSDPSIGLPSSGVSSFPAFVALSNGVATISTITCTPIIGNCIGVPITFTITIFPKPSVDFTMTEIGLSSTGTLVSFTSIVDATIVTSYLWDFNDGNQDNAANPNHEFSDVDGNSQYEITLSVQSNEGCQNTVLKSISIESDPFYYVPNSFTPNGDEHNNVFKPVISNHYDVQGYELNIFNRWGELIFESHDSNIGWDGTYNNTLVPDGTYTWVLRLSEINIDKKLVDTGSVNVIR